MNFTKNPANFNDTEKLLYLIWQEQQKQTGLLQNMQQPEPVCPTREGVEEKKKSNGDTITCKKCGAVFDNRGKFFTHMKQHKKEGT